MVDLPPDADPARLMTSCGGRGTSVVSLNPLRETLEDYFVQTVARGRAAPDGGSERCAPSLLVAGAVFKESVRDRVPYTMVMFAVLMMAASYLISQLTAGQDLKIIKDLGLAALSIFGLLIAMFIGIGLVSKEVEQKSVFALLAKPVTRTQFILGKYAGPGDDAGGQPRGDDGGVLRRAGVHGHDVTAARRPAGRRRRSIRGCSSPSS